MVTVHETAEESWQHLSHHHRAGSAPVKEPNFEFGAFKYNVNLCKAEQVEKKKENNGDGVKNQSAGR